MVPQRTGSLSSPKSGVTWEGYRPDLLKNSMNVLTARAERGMAQGHYCHAHTKGSSQNLMETSGNSASLCTFLWTQSLNSTSIAPGVLAVAMQCNQKKGRKELCLPTTTGLVHIFALQTLLPSQIRELSIAVNGKWKNHTDAQNHLPLLRTWEHLRLPPSSMILNGTSAHQN